MDRIETRTFHFNLEYSGLDREYFLETGEGDRVPLRRHTAETRAQHRERNQALALFSDAALEHVTHFVEDAELPRDVARLLRVTFTIPGAPLPGVAAMIPYVPQATRREHREKNLDRFRSRRPVVFDRFGVEAKIADGVLTLTLPKAESARPKRIQVSVN